MLNTTPDLRIVPLDDLMLHEREEDGRRENLRERMTEEGMLRNPMIAAATRGDGRLLVLDGVHRYHALRDLGCKDALVQVVDYDDDSIQLYTWCRLIPNLTDFVTKIKTLGLRTRETKEASAVSALNEGKAYGYVRGKSGSCMVIKSNGTSLSDRTEMLHKILDSCGGLPRVRCEDIDRHLKLGKAEASFEMGAYTKSEVLELARSENKLPAGTTRHIIPGRALNIDISLDLLKSSMSIEKKNEILARKIDQLAAEGRIRYYPESLWIFDE